MHVSTDETAAAALPLQRSDPFEPPERLAELRVRAPLCRLRYPDGAVGWLVTSHALARAVLIDPRFIVSDSPLTNVPVGDPVKRAEVVAALRDELGPMLSANLLAMDPPRHTRLRRLLAGRFAAAAVEEHRHAIDQLVGSVLDDVVRTGPPADLLMRFAAPVALHTQCAVFGVPRADAHRLSGFKDVAVDPRSTADEIVVAWRAFRAYVSEVIEQARGGHVDGLIGALVAGAELSDEEILSLVFFLLDAGHETVASMLVMSAFAVLCHPEQREPVAAGDAAAVEELLRYLTVFQFGFTRTAREPVEVGGVTVSPGERVTVSLPAANHDPERFAAPERLDVTRTARGHVAFGYGVHVCLGQHLARLVLRTALPALLRRFPELALAEPLERIETLQGQPVLVYGLRALPVTW